MRASKLVAVDDHSYKLAFTTSLGELWITEWDERNYCMEVSASFNLTGESDRPLPLSTTLLGVLPTGEMARYNFSGCVPSNIY